jgi:hypothetical protein
MSKYPQTYQPLTADFSATGGRLKRTVLQHPPGYKPWDSSVKSLASILQFFNSSILQSKIARLSLANQPEKPVSSRASAGNSKPLLTINSTSKNSSSSSPNLPSILVDKIFPAIRFNRHVPVVVSVN